ncbi:L-lactate dehydrogenase [Cupriavidus necator H850]|jgi:isopentenyl diphosphate isomerase/L-lactate dehydrogenase-like FMN-dependent dehydrogenase|uniref:hypothetical protein n=1 Tax=Cupriavidus TaxID=106589 RepID=UPI00129DF3D2|nr:MULTISPECIES: hypothetical protein [Cupriavidus]KAI3600241.1 L-lactate dehydrogenase [Cupriavidus necator H850]MDX6009283.1 hypothetical protein [Cupriavidus necator]QUN31618.1 hypothetical protein KB879_16125 [Cupriavidus sp. KK10]
MSSINEIEDLRRLARQRVPRMFYEYADSGSWTESASKSIWTAAHRAAAASACSVIFLP